MSHQQGNIDSLKNLQEEDLVYFGFRVEPYFASDMILSGMLNEKALKEIFGWDTGVRWIQADYYFFQFKQDLDAAEKELKKNLQEKGISYVDSIVRQCEEYGAELLKISRELGGKDHSAERREDLAKALENYQVIATRYLTFYCIALFEGPMMEIARDLAKKYSTDLSNTDELLDLITTSSQETAVEHEQEDFLALASGKRGDKQVAAEAHADTYGWLSIRFFLGTPWKAEDILTRLKSIRPSDAEEQLKMRLGERREREKRIGHALQFFTEQDKEIVNQIRKIVYLRNQRADFFNESAYYSRPLLEKIAVVLGLRYADMVNLSIREIASALRGTLQDFKKHIEMRQRAFLVYHKGENSIIIDGEQAEVYLNEHSFLLPEQEDVEEITGTIGCKGKVTGIVRIVKVETDISKVENGDVLITPMTIPNFIPAMEKAVAFVTDEGGITCHAAIIAREMKKPCIIGTKIATQALKDGDLVEVDADSGIVRILGR